MVKREVVGNSTTITRYMECQKNHAACSGGYAVDGCMKFMASTAAGDQGALTCAACGCHRNFHKKEQLQSTAD